MLLISLVVWFLSNPTLYPNGLSHTYDYIAFRVEQTQKIQYAFPEATLSTIPQRITASVCTILYRCDYGNLPDGAFLGWTGMYVVVLAFGIVSGLRTVYHRQVTEIRLFVLCLISQVILYSVVYLPLAYDRYFLPFIPIMAGFYLVGIREIIRIGSDFRGKLAKIKR